MMYQEKFVAALKVDGKILRENKDVVTVPFSSEYSILMKNLHTQRAVVSVFIDGEDVLNKHRLIIEPGKDLELERFLNELDKGNKFLFIKKTDKVSEYRGDKLEDGLVKVEFQFEAPVKPYADMIPRSGGCSANSRGVTPKGLGYSSNNFGWSEMSYSSVTTASLSNVVEDGITVKGSESTQQFSIGAVGRLESEKHSIVLKLVGTDNKEAAFVSSKKRCTTCGTVAESKDKFCSECGTFIE